MAHKEHTFRSGFKLLLASLLAFGLDQTAAAATEPQDVVREVNGALLNAMQQADSLGYEGRYDLLEPVLTDSFNFAFMARLAVGRMWNDLATDEKRRVASLFAEMSVGNFADRFDGYSGERFRIMGEDDGPRGTVLINNELVKTDGDTVGLNYLLRDFGGGDWQIIDIYLDSKFSELARQRSEFGAVLRSGGYPALTNSLEAKIDALGG